VAARGQIEGGEQVPHAFARRLVGSLRDDVTGDEVGCRVRGDLGSGNLRRRRVVTAAAP
jgi:hypothetical protein